MTINDQEVNEMVVEVHAQAKVLDMYMRDGSEAKLFRALSIIEDAARKAQWRLNDMRFKK